MMHIFDSISIVENKKNTLIKLKEVKAKKFLIEYNENLDLELIQNKFTEVEYTNNLESLRLCLTDVQIVEGLNIDNSNLEYLYIENSSIEKLRVDNTKIRNEGIAIKKTLLEGFFIGGKSSIYRINISDISIVNSFGISDSIVNYINIDGTVIKSIQFTTVDKLDELTFYKKSEIKSINIYFSLINRFLISEESIMEEVVIQKETSINLFQATDNCKISWITIKKSNIFLFIFYRGISIKYFESDSESNIGDFDMLESTIKSLILTNQTNSYNFQNTEIGLLKLDECKISYINILNGCKIEAYISNCKIDKVDFKQIIILKDTLISFSSCKIYSLIMENFSVIGSLYFRELTPLKAPLNEEWSNINKYTFNHTLFKEDIEKQVQFIKSIILECLKTKNNNWINESTDNNEHNLINLLIEHDYISSKISDNEVEFLIDNLKQAYHSEKSWYEKNFLRMIDKYTFENLKALRNLTDVNRENLEYNKNILQFIWTAISKMYSYNLLFQNINKPLFRVYQSDFCDKKVKFLYDENLFNILKYHTKDFPSFLNPARRLEQIKPIKDLGSLNLLSNLIDFLSRIILTFGIYQLIVAFRKNAKKQ